MQVKLRLKAIISYTSHSGLCPVLQMHLVSTGIYQKIKIIKHGTLVYSKHLFCRRNVDQMDDDSTFSAGLNLALNTVQRWVSGFYAMLPNLIVGVVVLVLTGILAYSMGRIISGYFDRRDRTDLGRILADFAFWALVVFGILVALTIIVPSLNPADLLASLGIGSLAIGFAFKDILQNWLAGLLILLRLPFRRGDQIRVDEAEGTVQRIEPRATIIRTYDGRDIVVPNTTIYTNMVIIHTSQPCRRVELDFTVGYVYEIRRITAIIESCLRGVEEILADPPPQILCWELGSTSLGIKIRWWINSNRSQEVISRARAVQAIKEAFDANNVDPTDPQLIYYQTLKNETPFVQTNETDIVTTEGPPPEMEVSVNDPESEKPKMDSKDKTMLPEN